MLIGKIRNLSVCLVLSLTILALLIPSGHSPGLLYQMPFEIGEAAYSADRVYPEGHLWGSMTASYSTGVTGVFYSAFGLEEGSIPNGQNYPSLQITADKAFYADRTDYLYFFTNYWANVHVHIAKCSSAWYFGAYRVYNTNNDPSNLQKTNIIIPDARFEFDGGSSDCLFGSDIDLHVNKVDSRSFTLTLGAIPAGHYYIFELNWFITANPGSYIVNEGGVSSGAFMDQGGYGPGPTGGGYNGCLVLSWASSPRTWCTPSPPLPPPGGGGGGCSRISGILMAPSSIRKIGPSLPHPC